MPVPLVENAPAKVNLTLRVLRRRDDGYHELESLVVFADFGDRLSLSRGGELKLLVRGPGAAQAGEGDDNLVLKAARAFARLHSRAALGTFRLDKRLPVAAGLGGGSADAAAALRLIAQANGLAGNDPDLYAAAKATGADVPVCLDPRPRIMRGVGEICPLRLPCRNCQACWSTPAWPCRPRRCLHDGRQRRTLKSHQISTRSRNFQTAIGFCNFSTGSRTIWKLRPSQSSR